MVTSSISTSATPEHCTTQPGGPLLVVTPPSDLPSQGETSKTDTATSATNEPLKHMLDANIYYEVLMVEQDDIIHISKADILSRQCNVTLDKLTDSDIEALCTSKGTQQHDSSIDSEPPAKKKPTSHRLRRKLSKERMAAQQIISERNRKIKVKLIKPSRIREDPVLPQTPSSKPEAPKATDDDEKGNSDDTVIYTPPR